MEYISFQGHKNTFIIAHKEAFIDENIQSLCIVMEYADKGDLYQKNMSI